MTWYNICCSRGADITQTHEYITCIQEAAAQSLSGMSADLYRKESRADMAAKATGGGWLL